MNGNGEYVDADSRFTAKVTEPGVVKINLAKMPSVFKGTKSVLQIDGSEGKDSNTTNVSVIRKP